MTTTTSTVVTGKDILRQGLQGWHRSPESWTRRVKDLKIVGSDDLANFMRGGTLPVEALKALAAEMFDGAGFDPERNLLTKPVRPEPTSYMLPPTVVPERFPDRWKPRHVGGLVMPPPPVKPPRPGWV